MEKEISLVQIAKAMWKKAWLIILLTVIGAIVAYSISAFLIDPQYTSNAKLYVYNPKAEGTTINTSDFSIAKHLVDTYIVILKSNSVLNDVADDLNALRGTQGHDFLDKENEYTAARISKMISAASINDTEAFSIDVKASSPEEAKLINEKILEKLQPALIDKVKAGSVNIIDSPTLAKEPSSPSISKNTMIGALIGFFIAAAIICLLHMTDTVIRDESNLEEAFENISVLGVIPVIQSSKSQKYTSENNSAEKQKA